MMINEKGQKASKAMTVLMAVAQVILCVSIVLPVFNYAKAVVRGQLSASIFFSPFAIYLLTMICYTVIVFLTAKVFKAVKLQETPFVKSNVKLLKSISVLAGGVSAFRILGCLLFLMWFLPGGFIVLGGESLLGFDITVLSLSLNASARAIDLSSVVLGVIALLVYGIALFTQYGVELQNQADETL